MHFEEIFVDAPWGKIATLVGGNPKGKPILLVHGLLDSANTFVQVVNYLPDNFWYVLIDLPGCGKSDHFPKGSLLYFIQYIVPINIIIDYFKLTKITYVGHSIGGVLGLYFHLRHPNLIERIVCIDAISFLPIDPDIFFGYVEYYYEDFYNPKKYPVYNGIIPSKTYTYEQVLELLMTSRGLTKEAAQYAAERNIIPVGDNLYRFSWDQRLKKFIAPLMYSDYQNKLMENVKIPHLTILTFDFKSLLVRVVKLGYDILDVFIKSNPDFELILVDGNHDMQLNDPKTIAKYIEDFINGVKQCREKTLENKEKYKKIGLSRL